MEFRLSYSKIMDYLLAWPKQSYEFTEEMGGEFNNDMILVTYIDFILKLVFE
jgi:hypothetical protein